MRKIEKYSNDNKAISKIVEMIGEELLELKMNQKNFQKCCFVLKMKI